MFFVLDCVLDSVSSRLSLRAVVPIPYTNTQYPTPVTYQVTGFDNNLRDIWDFLRFNDKEVPVVD
jgi:hypothetical protein